MPEKKVADKKTLVREPVVNGQFYEGNPERLKRDIKKYLDSAPEIKIEGDLIGFVEPHAGYIYSAPVAAYGYKQLIGKKYQTVIVMAPSHRYPFSGVSVMKEGIYRTPLGDVPVDSDLAEKICKYKPEEIRYVPQADAYEHSLEVQVPFLQETLESGWKIVPIVFGDADPETSKMVAEAILPHFDPTKHLMIASSDMSHYHPYQAACDMDKPALEKVEKLDIVGLWDGYSKRKLEFCGIGPVMTLMMYTKHWGGKAKILKYANSGDTAGDKRQVVGYGCVAFSVEPGRIKTVESKAESKVEDKVDFTVTEEEKKMLLAMARKTLEEKLINGKDVEFNEPSELLDRELGLFVTLRLKNGDLRGCIGHCFPVKKLRYALPELALASALNDPRFRPVRKDELKDIKIEISLLSPMRFIKDYNEIKIPGHGVYVKKGFHAGVFLPQVAEETGWDRETFMAHLCRDKAGLPPDEWKKPNVELYVFTVIKFEEE